VKTVFETAAVTLNLLFLVGAVGLLLRKDGGGQTDRLGALLLLAGAASSLLAIAL
jgi:hypothetical protein